MSANESEVIPEFQRRKFAKEIMDYALQTNMELLHRAEWITMVQLFHKIYGQPIRNTPQFLNNKELALRVSLIEEEFKEFQSGVATYRNRDKLLGFVEMVDAMGDMIYVILGTFISMGIDADSVMREIQLSNMSKLMSDGSPLLRADGKVLKGPNYFKPDFKRFFRVVQQEA